MATILVLTMDGGVKCAREILSVFMVRGPERMAPQELVGREITDPPLFYILGFFSFHGTLGDPNLEPLFL